MPDYPVAVPRWKMFPGSSLRRTAVAATIGYFLGSLPSASMAMRMAGARNDLTLSGTNNPGTYNVYGHLGGRWAAAVGLADTGKGAAAAAIGRFVAGDSGGYAAATTSVLGHVFPIGRRGGKGVATSWGSCLVVFPVYAPVDALVAAGLTGFRRRAPAGARTRPAVLIASATFVGAAGLWSWRRLPNPGGPRPGPGLVAYALITSAALAWRWLPAGAAPTSPELTE